MLGWNTGECQILQLLGNLITRRKLKTWNYIQDCHGKTTFNRKITTLLTSKVDLNLGKKLEICHTWSIALYGAGIWTLWKVDQKYLESFEMWCKRKLEKISRTDRVRNEEVLQESRRRGTLYKQYKEGRLNGLVTSCVRTAF